MGFDFQTSYEGIIFDPKRMWFLPLEARSAPGDLGLRVGVPDWEPGHARIAMNAVLVILDSALGERSRATDIQHVEVTEVPLKPETHGYIRLAELPDYLAWRKQG